MKIANEWGSSRLSKVTVLVVVGSGLVWLSMLVAGALADEFRGYAAFGIIAACIVMWIAAALSSGALPATSSLVRVVWLSWALVALAMGLALGRNGEGAAVMSYAMNALAFPAGLLALPLGGPLAEQLPWGVAVTFLWVLMTILGYVQWFVVVARVIRRRRQSGDNSD